jgi:hypothetical protein
VPLFCRGVSFIFQPSEFEMSREFARISLIHRTCVLPACFSSRSVQSLEENEATHILTLSPFGPLSGLAFALFCLVLSFQVIAAGDTEVGKLSGKILDPQGVPVAGAHLKLINPAGALIRETTSDAKGNFLMEGVDFGGYQLRGESESFVSVVEDVSLASQQKEVNLQFLQLASVLQAITVVASAPSSLTPDPAQTVVIHDQVLDANPGRPGAPISIPGLPHLAESKRHNTLHLAWPLIMENPSRNSFKSAISFSRIISQLMPTVTVIRIRIF